jgi:hypothetical protein
MSAAAAGCLPLDVACQVNSFFAGIDLSILQSMLGVIGSSELTTSDVTTSPAVQAMSLATLGVTDALFVLLILTSGGILMGYRTYQGSYAAREVAPRLVIAMVAANTSLLVVSKAIGLSNGISRAVSGGVLPSDAANRLNQMLVGNASRGGIAILLLTLVCAILAVIIAVTNVIRVMGLVLLVAMAPLALSGYALPYTSWAPRWWWRALAVALAIPPAQALTLNAAMHVFFTPGWPALNASPGSGPGTVLASRVTTGPAPAHLLASSTDPFAGLLTAVCLLYVMARIPFWLSRPILAPYGRSPIRSLLRFAFGAAVLSRFGRTLRPSPRGGTARSGTPRRRPAGGSARRAGGGPRGAPGRGTRGTGTRRPAGSTASRTGSRSGRAGSGPVPAGGADGGDGPAVGGIAPTGMLARPSGSARAARHAAPSPLPDGSPSYSARHAAPPPLPAGGFPSRPTPRLPGSPQNPRPVPPSPTGSAQRSPVPPLPSTAVRPGHASTALPAADVSMPGRHRRTPPLPAVGAGASGRHAQPPPLPAGQPGSRPGDQTLPGDQTRPRPTPPPASPAEPHPPQQPTRNRQPRGAGRQPRRGPRS